MHAALYTAILALMHNGRLYSNSRGATVPHVSSTLFQFGPKDKELTYVMFLLVAHLTAAKYTDAYTNM